VQSPSPKDQFEVEITGTALRPAGNKLGFFLAGDGLSWAFARASVCVRPLAVNRQTATMAEATVAPEIHQAFNVHRDFAAKITFHSEFTVDRFTNLKNFAIRQLVDAAISRDFNPFTDLLSEFWADAMDVLERNNGALLGRNVNACDTGHSVSPNA
jgi:hypothetical protein